MKMQSVHRPEKLKCYNGAGYKARQERVLGNHWKCHDVETGLATIVLDPSPVI